MNRASVMYPASMLARYRVNSPANAGAMRSACTTKTALAAARPDILLGQTLCQVCAVTVSQLPVVMDPSPEIVPLDADSIAGIFDDIERVGEAIGRAREASRLVTSLRERIERVRERVA